LNRIKNKIIDLLVWYIERDMNPTRPFNKELNVFFANLYELPGFTNYCKNRAEHFKNALSKGLTTTEGVPMELPSRIYIRYFSQRIENALLFRKAQRAFEMRAKKKK